MGIQEQRHGYKEEFRQEILNSACELFIDDGYEKFSMRRLAKEIDDSPSTIYPYFKNNEEEYPCFSHFS